MVSDIGFDGFLESTTELGLFMHLCLLKMSLESLGHVDGSSRDKSSARRTVKAPRRSVYRAHTLIPTAFISLIQHLDLTLC